MGGEHVQVLGVVQSLLVKKGNTWTHWKLSYSDGKIYPKLLLIKSYSIQKLINTRSSFRFPNPNYLVH